MNQRATRGIWLAMAWTCLAVAACATGGNPDGGQSTGALAAPTIVKCKGAKSVDCDDGNPCTSDTCDKKLGCLHSNVAGSCNDGDACTSGDQCSGGVCGGTPVNCDDLNACTIDACQAGTCQHTPKDCDDSDACTFDACEAGVCVHEPVSCDDGDACTQDGCAGGSCTHDPVVCNDNNPCTDESCIPGQGCVAVPNSNPCDDDNPCTTDDLCSGGGCYGITKDCSDGDPCTADACNGISGACVHDAHGVCGLGGPLEAACSSCVAAMCAYDEFCCEEAWDSICVSEVGEVCGTPCPSAPSSQSKSGRPHAPRGPK